MFHFISTPLIQVPHNPNWILARCCGEYCRVLTMRGHKKPTQAGSNDAEDELMVAISPQISPRATADSSAARTASASQHGGGATDTRWQHGQHIYISFIQCQNIYIIYIFCFRTALTARTSPTALRSPALTTSSTVPRCVIMRHYSRDTCTLWCGHVARVAPPSPLQHGHCYVTRHYQITWGHVTNSEHCRV